MDVEGRRQKVVVDAAAGVGLTSSVLGQCAAVTLDPGPWTLELRARMVYVRIALLPIYPRYLPGR